MCISVISFVADTIIIYGYVSVVPVDNSTGGFEKDKHTRCYFSNSEQSLWSIKITRSASRPRKNEHVYEYVFFSVLTARSLHYYELLIVVILIFWNSLLVLANINTYVCCCLYIYLYVHDIAILFFFSKNNQSSVIKNISHVYIKILPFGGSWVQFLPSDTSIYLIIRNIVKFITRINVCNVKI